VLQQVREGLGVADVVDRDDLKISLELVGCAVDVPADTSESVDSYF
jgi:hypothetical protein